MLQLDHLAVACADLGEGAAWVEERLGVRLQPGGQHLRYGTHNRLLGLADGIYFEVIAKDPSLQPEAGHSWFDLDQFSGPPRLANWICQTDEFEAALALAPADVGAPQLQTRDDLSWQITVPEGGRLPYQGAYPTLISWGPDVPHPSATLPKSGCALRSFEVTHPNASALSAMMVLEDPRITLTEGPFSMQATFDTPHGVRRL